MLTVDDLKSLLHRKGLTRADQLLMLVACDPPGPRKPMQLREIAVQAGLRTTHKWNISDILARETGKVVNTPHGWELTPAGEQYLVQLGVVKQVGAAASVAVDLRKELAPLAGTHIYGFVEEAIVCLESRLFRAAVVLSWVGALAILYDYVVTNKLTAFNAEATRLDPKWKAAKNVDGLANMKEHTFLDILQTIGVLGKNVKQELQKALSLRNGCGHPNTLKIGQQMVAAHVESLILNVYRVF